MTQTNNARIGMAAYKSLGLIANPFSDHRNRAGETTAQSLSMQAMGNNLLKRIDAMADEDRSRTLWVEKSDQVNNYYHRGALVYSEETLIRDTDLNVLPCYIQLFAAKIGRVRSVLNVVAERVATREFDQTLAAWVGQFVDEPDTELPQWDQLDEGAWDAFKTAYAKEPVQAIADHFGPLELFRKIEVQPPADVRLASLEEEPEETDDSAEDDAVTARMPDYEGIDPDSLLKQEGDQESEDVSDPIVEYIIAYTKAHLSSVIARGLRQYYERGFGPLSEELKITRAPRKTLKALTTLARLRFRKVVLLFDGFDNWVFMPEDLRIKYITALTEMRLNLGSGAMFIFFVGTNGAGELEEHFGSADRLVWDFPDLQRVGEIGDAFDAEVVQGWIGAASLSSQALSATDGPLAELAQEASEGMTAFCSMAAAAVDDASTRGVGGLDSEAIKAGRAARPEAI